MDRLEEIARALEVDSLPDESVDWLIEEIRRLRRFFANEYICQKCWFRQHELTEKGKVEF